MVELENVNRGHYQFLYDLLQEREPIVNISHRSMPTYEDHVIFWSQNPYSMAYIIYAIIEGPPAERNPVGLLYLTKKHEVGVQIKKSEQSKKYGDDAMLVLIEDFNFKYIDLLANIAPDNDVSKNFFKKHKFKELQHTYKRDREQKPDTQPNLSVS